jgi:beta-1,4-mannosyltransferase
MKSEKNCRINYCATMADESKETVRLNTLSAAVLVVGDVGRSPRMQYHALSMLSHFQHVSIIGTKGAPPLPELQQAAAESRASFHWLPEFGLPKPKSRFLYIPFAVLKAIFGLIELLAILLFSVPKFDVLIVQNPPSIPTLFVCQLVSALKNVRLVIDWHNYGWTILGHSLGSNSHIMVKIAKYYEKLFGADADANLCVTKAMQDDLKSNWKVEADVFYDHPPSWFKKATKEQSAAVSLEMIQTLSHVDSCSCSPNYLKMEVLMRFLTLYP